MSEFRHTPVLVNEVLEHLPPETRNILDCTLGGAGHSRALLKEVPQAQLRGIDRDPNALAAARERLEGEFPEQVKLRQARFSDLQAYLSLWSLKYDFILADLGVSSEQLSRAERGFSFLEEGPLDMRMDPQEATPTAAQLLARVQEGELRQWLKIYGEERFAPQIARAVVESRQKSPLQTTRDLSELVHRVIPKRFHKPNFNPATLTFQALRIVVNRELEEVEGLLAIAPEFLSAGGRLAIISFHSLEDRLVKQTFRGWEAPCTCPPKLPYCVCGLKPLGRALTRRPVTASEKEVRENPRSRSAKLRVFELAETS